MPLKYLLGQSVVSIMLIMLMISCGQHEHVQQDTTAVATDASISEEPDQRMNNSTSAGVKWEEQSKEGAFAIAIYPVDGEILVGRFQEWVVKVSDRNGQDVNNARVVFNGGMPSHGHGMASDPQVTSHEGQGQYGVEGVKFTMAGPWQMNVIVQTSDAADKATFDIEVEY